MTSNAMDSLVRPWYDPTQEAKGGPMKVQVPNIDELFELDGYIRDHEGEIRRRYGIFTDFLARIDELEGSLENFSLGYKQFGPQVGQRQHSFY